jgi:hypothetical protein
MSAIGEPVAAIPRPHLQWSAIFAGAITAAGAAFTLHAFATGIGLSVASTAPTWRDSSALYWILAGVYLLFVAVVAFSVGGYVAGRMRAPLNIDAVDTEFRDGMHGLITWGLAILLTAGLALGTAATTAPAVAPSGGSTGAAQSIAGENIIASELDELFRTDKVIENLTYRRAEAARILLKSSSHNGVPNSDRRYLTSLTRALSGLSDSEANERVDRAITTSAEELRRARIVAVLQAFFVAVALLAGIAVAWHAATQGGKDRERGAYHYWEWRRRHDTGLPYEASRS